MTTDTTPTSFEALWRAAQDRGPSTGVPTYGEVFMAAAWYHRGAADMALAFASGQGPMLEKLEAIRAEIAKLAELATAKNAHAQRVGEDS